jgi:hypothetical protein
MARSENEDTVEASEKSEAVTSTSLGSDPAPRVVTLLGAGASVPFDMPTLADFGALVAVRQHLGDEKDWTESDHELLRYAENLDLYARNTAKPAGIESAIDRIDEYCEFLGNVHRDGNCTTYLFPINYDHHRSELMSELAVVVRRILLCQLVKTYSKEIMPQSGKALCDLFRVLRKIAGPAHLPIFTTNYDTAITQLAKTSPSRNLTLDIKLDDDVSVALTRLHGCVEWCYVAGRSDGSYDACDVGRKCHKQNLGVDGKDCLLSCGVAGKSCRPDRVVIKTGVGNPELKLDRKPFSDAYQLFEKSLGECQVICVIGFGFRDRDVVNALARALRDQSKPRHLVVVDLFLKVEEITRRLGGTGFREGSIKVVSRDLREPMCATELMNALGRVPAANGGSSPP